MLPFSEDENLSLIALQRLSQEPVRRRSRQTVPTQTVENVQMVADRREEQPNLRLEDTRNNRELPARTARRARSRASDPSYIPPPSARRCGSGSSPSILRRSKRLRLSHVVAEVDEPERNNSSNNTIRTLTTTAAGLEIAQQSSEQAFKQAAMGFKQAAVELERAGGQLEQVAVKYFPEYFNQGRARLPKDDLVYIVVLEILKVCRKGNKTTHKLFHDFSTYCVDYLM